MDGSIGGAQKSYEIGGRRLALKYLNIFKTGSMPGETEKSGIMIQFL